MLCIGSSRSSFRWHRFLEFTSTLDLQENAITDLTPLQGMPLQEIHLTPKEFTQSLDILRDTKSLNHRHQSGASLAGGGVLGSPRQGGVQVSGWADATSCRKLGLPHRPREHPIGTCDSNIGESPRAAGASLSRAGAGSRSRSAAARPAASTSSGGRPIRAISRAARYNNTTRFPAGGGLPGHGSGYPEPRQGLCQHSLPERLDHRTQDCPPRLPNEQADE